MTNDENIDYGIENVADVARIFFCGVYMDWAIP